MTSNGTKEIKRYVLGFVFRTFGTTLKVALIRKKYGPPAVVGKLNGIGGKQEGIESLLDAMQREWFEETGDNTVRFERFGLLRGNSGWDVHLFRGETDGDIRTTTDEEVDWLAVDDMPKHRAIIMRNLFWMIPMALDKDIWDSYMQDIT